MDWTTRRAERRPAAKAGGNATLGKFAREEAGRPRGWTRARRAQETRGARLLRGAAHPCREHLELGIVLCRPVLSAAMPVTAPSLFGERVQEEHAFQRFTRHDKPLDTLEVPARLFLAVFLRACGERLEKAVAATARMTRDASSIAFSSCGQYREDPRLENLEVERRRSLSGRRLLRTDRCPTCDEYR